MGWRAELRAWWRLNWHLVVAGAALVGAAAAWPDKPEGPCVRHTRYGCEARAAAAPTWAYTVRGERDALAAIASDEPGAVLGVQVWPDEGDPSVFFRATAGPFQCASPCGVPVVIDGRRALWTGATDGDVLVLDFPHDAIAALRSARVVTARLPSGPHTFRVAGFKPGRVGYIEPANQ